MSKKPKEQGHKAPETATHDPSELTEEELRNVAGAAAHFNYKLDEERTSTPSGQSTTLKRKG